MVRDHGPVLTTDEIEALRRPFDAEKPHDLRSRSRLAPPLLVAMMATTAWLLSINDLKQSDPPRDPTAPSAWSEPAGIALASFLVPLASAPALQAEPTHTNPPVPAMDIPKAQIGPKGGTVPSPVLSKIVTRPTTTAITTRTKPSNPLATLISGLVHGDGGAPKTGYAAQHQSSHASHGAPSNRHGGARTEHAAH